MERMTKYCFIKGKRPTKQIVAAFIPWFEKSGDDWKQ